MLRRFWNDELSPILIHFLVVLTLAACLFVFGMLIQWVQESRPEHVEQLEVLEAIDYLIMLVLLSLFGLYTILHLSIFLIAELIRVWNRNTSRRNTKNEPALEGKK